MKKKILLLAYTNINFGDDMFIKTICNYFPNEEFVLEAPKKYREIFLETSNLEIKTEKLWTGFRKKIQRKLRVYGFHYQQDICLKKYKAIVYVVGGLFDEDNIWHSNIKRVGIKEMKNLIWKNSFCYDAPFFLLGCNMTRVKTNKYIEQMEYLFDGLADICFRDKYSYQFFSHMKNVRYAPDIVLNYRCELKKIKLNKILVSVWGPLTQCGKLIQWKWAGELWPFYEEFIIKIVKYFMSQEKEIHLLALCENEGDLEACKKIVDKGEFKNKVLIDVYNGNLNEVINLFETSEFVVGTRFHSVVMAMNANVAFYPIVYESKTLQLLKDAGYTGHYSHIEDVLSYRIENMIDMYTSDVKFDYTKLKEQAIQQFDKLSEFLNKG